VILDAAPLAACMMRQPAPTRHHAVLDRLVVDGGIDRFDDFIDALKVFADEGEKNQGWEVMSSFLLNCIPGE